MDLYLVRHAIAEPRDADRWPDDSLRPLTRAGAASFRRAGRGLRRLGIEVDAMLASSYVRAWQTSELLVEEAGWPGAEPCSELEPSAAPPTALAAIRGRSERSLALVGHEPGLGRLASLLLAGSPDAIELEVKKGAVLSLRCDGPPAPAIASLRWSAGPKLLRRAAG
jgi:phosphohistidine phosphatase